MTVADGHFLGLDIGERRIGVAYADGKVPIAVPLPTLTVNGTEFKQLQALLEERDITDVVIGLPRNQSGEETAQSAYVRRIADELLHGAAVAVHYQDESLTSVLAEDQLNAQRKPYQKSDIDARAAAIILQDFLEQ